MTKNLIVTALFAAGFACVTANALAQGTSPLPIDKATVSTEVAKRTLMKGQISATVARQLVDACLEFARNQQGGPGHVRHLRAVGDSERGLSETASAVR